MITRPLDLALELQPEPRSFDALFYINVGLVGLFFTRLLQGDRVALDLSECALMDSTFLGVLAGLGLKLSGGNGDQGRHGVELFNPNPRITELLETLGVLHLFTITQGDPTPAESTQALERAPANPSKAEVTRTCLEAHETLMALSPENAARFKDVTQFLAEGLKKAKTE